MDIVLIEPADGAFTEPLQRFCWPIEESGEESLAAATPIAWDNLTKVAVDRSVPRPVRFAWEVVPSVSGAAV